jgi:hypothetical protein
MPDAIQGLWIGERLSTMERLSIRSFLAHGHPYELYTYGPVEGLPEGAVLRDAEEIIPKKSIFKIENYYAGFSDFFRWKLLHDRGGWWADLDIVALKPFEFSGEYVFSSLLQGGKEIPTSGVVRAPAHSEALCWMCQACQNINISLMRWNDVGPDLVVKAVKRFKLEAFVQPAGTFCPLSWQQYTEAMKPRPKNEDLLNGATAVQLWGSMWARAKMDRNAAYSPRCLYERLKKRYLN